MITAWFLLLRFGISLFLRCPGSSWVSILFAAGLVLVVEKRLAVAAWACAGQADSRAQDVNAAPPELSAAIQPS